MNLRALFCLFAFAATPNPLMAGLITATDIVASETLVSSGNGSVDLRMMTFSGGEIGNASGLFNFDNGNNTLPQGGGADTSSFAESYLTTGLELKDYYRLNFPDGLGGSTITEIVLLIDLNETGSGQAINHIDKIEIVQNPATINNSPNPSLDLTSATQADIDQIYTGGTILATLSSSPIIVPVNAQGAGHADYAVFTGINPFALSDSDAVLFNVSLSSLNSGAEEIFLSGDFTRSTAVAVPEPSTWLLAGLAGVLGLAARGRKVS